MDNTETFKDRAKKAGYTDFEIQNYLNSIHNKPADNVENPSNLEPTNNIETTNTVEPANNVRTTGNIEPANNVETTSNIAPTNNVTEKNLTEERKNFISEAKSLGFTDEQISEYFSKKEAKAKQQPRAPRNFSGTIVDNTPPEVVSARKLRASSQNIHGRWLTNAKLLWGGLADENLREQALKDLDDLNLNIISDLNANGVKAYLDAKTGDIKVNSDDGKSYSLTPTLLDSLVSSKFEIGGALWGAVKGAGLALFWGNAGPQAATLEELVTVPAFATWGAFSAGTRIFAGGTVGGGFGGAGGAGIDYLLNSYKLKKELEAAVAYSKMVDAGIADSVMSILAGGGMKIASKVSHLALATVGKAFKLAKNDNLDGAFDILLEDLNLTGEQLEALKLELYKVSPSQLNKTTPFGEVPLNSKELGIKIAAEGQPGGEHIILGAGRSLMKIKQRVNTRAKLFLDEANKIAYNFSAVTLRKNLDAYEKDVKDFFAQTKKLASDIIDRTDYRFDIDKLAVKPALRQAQKQISDPQTVKKFKNLIQNISQNTEFRSFSDLLDLRQIVRHEKNVAKAHRSREALGKSLTAVNKEIDRVVKEHLPKNQAKLWNEQFKEAREQYYTMKRLKEKGLYNVIMKSETLISDDIVSKLAKAGRGEVEGDEDVFNAIVTKIPTAYRYRVEGAIIDYHTKKLTLGEYSGLQGVHFPELYNMLNKYTFHSAQAREYVEMVKPFAKLFKNDVRLAHAIGGLPKDQFQSYLTYDPVARGKYALGSHFFNYIKQFKPTKDADRISLSKIVGNMLENPLDVKATKKFMDAIPLKDQVNMSELLENQRKLFAEFSDKTPKTLKSSQAIDTSKLDRVRGGLGSGYYLKDQIKNPDEFRQVFGIDLEVSDLANLSDIEDILGKNVSVEQLKNIKGLNTKLKKAGYKGIMHEYEIMLFDKPPK